MSKRINGTTLLEKIFEEELSFFNSKEFGDSKIYKKTGLFFKRESIEGLTSLLDTFLNQKLRNGIKLCSLHMESINRFFNYSNIFHFVEHDTNPYNFFNTEEVDYQAIMVEILFKTIRIFLCLLFEEKFLLYGCNKKC